MRRPCEQLPRSKPPSTAVDRLCGSRLAVARMRQTETPSPLASSDPPRPAQKVRHEANVKPVLLLHPGQQAPILSSSAIVLKATTLAKPPPIAVDPTGAFRSAR